MVLATIVLAAATAAAFPAAGMYRYAASLNGQPVGTWTVSVKPAGAGTEIDETSAAMIAGMQLAATASLVLGPDLAPIKYIGSYHTPEVSPGVSVTLTASSATIVSALSSQTQQRSLAANTRHFVVIEPGLLAGLFVLPAQLASWKDSAMTWITPTTGQAATLSPSANASLARPTDVPAADALLFIASPLVLTLWYDPATLVPDEIAVPSQNAVLTRERS
ncbi:MAG TPA: hypothetical protein VFF63_06205 [Candidatus Babeliales bacterium]|nr:hypothetical protein [Candidatus Babeliales bacterium]